MFLHFTKHHGIFQDNVMNRNEHVDVRLSIECDEKKELRRFFTLRNIMKSFRMI